MPLFTGACVCEHHKEVGCPLVPHHDGWCMQLVVVIVLVFLCVLYS